MILPFSTELNGKPTHFPEKILTGLHYGITGSHVHNYMMIYQSKAKVFKKYSLCHAKYHTIREDEKGRWKAGNNIHFVINNRRPDQYQFAPVITVVSTQTIIIKYWLSKKTRRYTLPYVLVDGKNIRGKALDLLAANDGFASREEFFEYFNTDFIGKIIHWTNIKY